MDNGRSESVRLVYNFIVNPITPGPTRNCDDTRQRRYPTDQDEQLSPHKDHSTAPVSRRTSPNLHLMTVFDEFPRKTRRPSSPTHPLCAANSSGRGSDWLGRLHIQGGVELAGLLSADNAEYHAGAIERVRL